MPAFTAIATAIVGSLFPSIVGTLLGTIVGGIIATGIAMLTSRLINGSPGTGGSAGPSPGTRVQLSPSTENKIPVLYGEAYCNPIIMDAYLDDADGKKNNVMTYVMVISETCNIDGATYTVGDVYYNDMRLVFGNGDDPSRATAGKKYVDPDIPYDPLNPGQEDFTDDKFDGHVFVNVYAGDVSHKIFGKHASAKDAVNAYGTHWDNTYKMQGLVFAVVQIKYNGEKGFTGLPTLTFKIKNNQDNPAAVLADYMVSDRYGANIPLANINSAALAEFEAFCNESGPYKPYGWQTGDPILTQKRYVINGLIDTNRTVKENIDTILLNSGAWMSYDVADGTWRVIPKRALPGTTWSGANQTGTPTDPAPQIIFNDDNITSGIQISSTRLDNLYNYADIDYFDKYNKDQRGYVKIEIDEELRNTNEPDNGIRLSLDLTNNNVQAERLANVELKQSRDDLIITFTAGHYGLQAQAGDVIAVYNTLYGWCEPTYPSGKYFRVLSTVEREVGEGALEQEITALEYNSRVYSNENIQEFTTSSNIGIIPRNSNPNIGVPLVEIGTINSTGGAPNFKINVKIPGSGGPYDKLEVWVAVGDDWSGTGGDLSFKGQILGTTLDVIQWYGRNVIRANAETPGVYTSLAGTGVETNTYVTQFGAALAEQYGNGKTGQYTVTPSHATNTGIRSMYGWVQAAKITGTTSGNVLTVTSVASGTVNVNSLIRLHSDVSTGKFTSTKDNNGNITYAVWNAVITEQLTGTTGGVGTYRLSSSPSNQASATTFIVSKAYPALTQYERIREVVPQAGIDGTYQVLDLREIAIINLPPNNLNKKYYIKCRLAIGDQYGEFSELSEVDLEPAVVYWDPDSQSALNIKTELVKMDFGKFTIPRNGLWLMRTATQLDAGTLANYNSDYFNLDLGNFSAEDEIASDDDIQDFTYDPND